MRENGRTSLGDRVGQRVFRLAAAHGLALYLILPLLSSCLVSKLGGDFDGSPADLHAELSAGAHALLAEARRGIDPDRLLDYHTHILGTGSGSTGAWVNPRMQSFWYPARRVRYAVFKSAAGISDDERADQQYIARLLDLLDHARPWGRHAILAFDRAYHRDGTPDEEGSAFYIPNDYVLSLAHAHPDKLVPVASVNPYRKDALAELDRCAKRGVRLLKWLPNAMGIDPADPALDAFYGRMRDLDITLLSHAGEEMAVHAGDQELGNPLRLRRPLDRGVRVIVAHCGSLGHGRDLDHPDRPWVSNFALFLRLMDTPAYDGRLFGEISAITQRNRVGSPGQPLRTLLERHDLHPRLVNGSDYPVPAVNFVIWTRTLRDAGFISGEERGYLNEIYRRNPLLFDFELKRTLRHPTTGKGFPPSVFMAHPDIPCGRATRAAGQGREAR